MLKVALTGGIATGKSYVVDALRRHGVPCVDADELTHGVTAAGTEATRAIVARFGDVLDSTGAVDRRVLGPMVFADAGARHDLEAIVHPAVYRAITMAFRAFELSGDRMGVADIPLLFEGKRDGDFDRVVATTCTEALQRERLRARGLNDEQIAQRLAAQMPAAEKAKRAHLVIDTGGSFEQTDAQIASTLEALRRLESPG